MSGYKERDAARATKTPEREVAAAWHQARDDSGVRENRNLDRPTRENREDARRLERKVIARDRDRPPERPDSSRTER